MRLFLGVELDEPLRAACAAAARELQEELQRARAKVAARWIPAESLHITLWFLGEVRDERVAPITDRLRDAWETAAFTLTVCGAGAFPPHGPPRLIWLGITEGSNSLSDVYRELGARLEPLGFEAERRPYHPHITIGRLTDAGRSARTVRTTLKASGVRPGSCQVCAVTLFRSHLSPHGSRYEPMLRVPLKGC